MTGCPIASSGVYPNICSAPAFQVWMISVQVLLIMASSDVSTMAASLARAASALFAFGDIYKDVNPTHDSAGIVL